MKNTCFAALTAGLVAAALSIPLSADTAPEYRDVTIPAGTRIGVRLNSPVNSKTSRAEDPIDATIIAPVKIKGVEVLPSGSQITGHVVSAKPSGKVKGRAQISMRFVTLKARGDSYPIAAAWSRVAPATKHEDAEKIGIPAAGGAIIGAIAGGGKGAAIGAAAGGGAGTAVVLATSGKEVSLAKGSIVSLRLQKPVTIRVPVKD